MFSVLFVGLRSWALPRLWMCYKEFWGRPERSTSWHLHLELVRGAASGQSLMGLFETYIWWVSC